MYTRSHTQSVMSVFQLYSSRGNRLKKYSKAQALDKIFKNIEMVKLIHYNSIKEHPKVRKIARCRCEML